MRMAIRSRPADEEGELSLAWEERGGYSGRKGKEERVYKEGRWKGEGRDEGETCGCDLSEDYKKCAAVPSTQSRRVESVFIFSFISTLCL